MVDVRLFWLGSQLAEEVEPQLPGNWSLDGGEAKPWLQAGFEARLKGQ